jgi:hypothetical protein
VRPQVDLFHSGMYDGYEIYVSVIRICCILRPLHNLQLENQNVIRSVRI